MFKSRLTLAALAGAMLYRSAEPGTDGSGVAAGTPAAAPKPEKIQAHGVTRPADGTSTGRVWAISDELSKAAGKPIERKAVMDKGVAEGLNPATIATQYGKWRVFNGLKGVVAEKAPKPPKAPKVKKGAEAPVIEGGAAPQGEQAAS